MKKPVQFLSRFFSFIPFMPIDNNPLMKLIIQNVFVANAPTPRKLVEQIWQSGQFGPKTGTLTDFMHFFLHQAGILATGEHIRNNSAIAFINTLIMHKLAIPVDRPRKISKKRLERFRVRKGG